MIDLADLVTAVPESVIVRSGPTSFTGAAVDSRALKGGELFFAVEGPARDGHDFLAHAVRGGATGVVICGDRTTPDRIGAAEITIVRVPDTLAALQGAAAAVRRRSRAAVVAVTGSAGKTTTKALVSTVLSSRFAVHSNRASFNNHLGVPLTMTGIDLQHTHVVAEIGTNHRGEIAHLARLVEPDVAVVTNVGMAHLGNFADREELAEEKTDLLRSTRRGGTWVINGDDQRLTEAASSLPEAAAAHIVKVGFGPSNDIRVVEIAVDEHGSRGKLEVGGEKYAFTLAVTGRHLAYAAMTAVAVGRAFDIPPEISLDALRGIPSPPGRASLQRISESLLVLDDSYNGSPDAMIAAVDLLRQLNGTVKVAVLGEMRELGRFAPELHAFVGQAVAEVATHLITIGADAASMRSAAAAAGLSRDRIVAASSATDAYRLACDIVSTESGQNAVVLAKGSRFMHMERVPLGLAGHELACTLSSCSLYVNCKDCPQLALA